MINTSPINVEPPINDYLIAPAELVIINFYIYPWILYIVLFRTSTKLISSNLLSISYL